MAKIIEYNRQRAVEYAKEFAFKRNPNYLDFDKYGGDCTNFISQCLFNANGVDNAKFQPYWFYVSSTNRSPSWTSVEFFYEYLLNNKSQGPVGELCNIKELSLGDVIQLKFFGNLLFSHSLLVTKLNYPIRSLSDVFITAHTIDCLDKPVSNYTFEKIRYIKIKHILST